MQPNTAGTWSMELESHTYVYMHSDSLVAKPLGKNKQINKGHRGTANTLNVLLVRTLLASANTSMLILYRCLKFPLTDAVNSTSYYHTGV